MQPLLTRLVPIVLIISLFALITVKEHGKRRREGRVLVRFICTAVLKLLQERGPLTEKELRQAFDSVWCNICHGHLHRCLEKLDGRQMIATFRDSKVDAWRLTLKLKGTARLAQTEGDGDFLLASAIDLAHLRHDHLHGCHFG